MPHIRQTHAEHTGTAWCNAKLDAMQWAFVDIDHAAYSAAQGSLIRPCRACVRAVVAALTFDAARASEGER